ncbi:tryptophan 7-halogenase [Aestuariicella hydrocarbonica]|uniref:Tryptophan 7-halogenase n=1 Tax=Pseudomaricurvus hydrocarbonicus TaxID=1470433 RepID=A0A9E5JVW1_9GAMM|nr:tryptophan halogenase family protein [Aestuariicella hydrocarbonica]NHO66451.1 tryptophan 7-halogenase [Aestuariicella hydrocarbonica]
MVHTRNNNNSIRQIVIVGGGTAGWITACSLSKVLSAGDYAITLVESDAIGIIGVGEATIPTIRDFHKMLGIDEAEFVRKTQASFKLGIEFHNWRNKGECYFHPFGQHGREFDSVSFHQYWMRANQAVDCGDLSEFSLCTLAAAAGKFVPSNNDPQSVLSNMGYAYHFDASLYANFLREIAEKAGVKRVEGKVVDVRQNPENRHIDSIFLESNQQIDGDLFIDCSGFAGLLIGKTLNAEFDDWSHLLPANRAVAVPTKNVGATKPYTMSIAHPAGWQWRIPLQHRTGNGLVYSSTFMSDDEATATLMSNLEGEALDEPRLLRFRTGRRKNAWVNNCVAIGLAAGFLEPLESTAIHLVQSAVSRLLQIFPGREFNDADIREYNQQTAREYDLVRDFVVLHYHATERTEPLWEYTRNMAVPDSLTQKIELFKNRGRFFDRQDDLFKKASWLSVMQGQGIHPGAYDPVADAKPLDRLIEVMQQMRHVFRESVDAMPTHDEFIAEHCKARPF